jgi:hypothetical protein
VRGSGVAPASCWSGRGLCPTLVPCRRWRSAHAGGLVPGRRLPCRRFGPHRDRSPRGSCLRLELGDGAHGKKMPDAADTPVTPP